MNPRAVIDAWNSFWFKPTSTSTLAVFRIAFGLVVFAWSVSLVPDATSLFTKDGILTDQPNYTGLVGGAWGLLGIFPSKAAMIVLLVALIVASLCLMLGVFSQAAALVVFLGVISFERRDPFVFNSGDVLIRLLALYLIFAPASAALSLVALRERPRELLDVPGASPLGDAADPDPVQRRVPDRRLDEGAGARPGTSAPRSRSPCASPT